MPDPFAEVAAAGLVVANVKMWNNLAQTGSLPALVSSTRQAPLVDILTVGFTTTEIDVLFGSLMVASLPTLELIARVAAARIAVCAVEVGLFAKRLPGGWKVSLESFSTFISAINSRPELAPGQPGCSYVLGYAGVNSIPGLVQAVGKLELRDWYSILGTLR